MLKGHSPHGQSSRALGPLPSGGHVPFLTQSRWAPWDLCCSAHAPVQGPPPPGADWQGDRKLSETEPRERPLETSDSRGNLGKVGPTPAALNCQGKCKWETRLLEITNTTSRMENILGWMKSGLDIAKKKIL